MECDSSKRGGSLWGDNGKASKHTTPLKVEVGYGGAAVIEVRLDALRLFVAILGLGKEGFSLIVNRLYVLTLSCCPVNDAFRTAQMDIAPLQQACTCCMAFSQRTPIVFPWRQNILESWKHATRR